MCKKSKLLSLTMCMIMSAVMVAGCSSSSGSGEKKDIVKSDVTEAVEEEKDVEQSTATGEDEELQVETEEAASTDDVTIEEQVLFEQDGIKVTATGYETDSIWGDGVKLLLENDSDKDVTVSCEELIVNDYMITDLFSSSIAAGKKANDDLYLSDSGLKAAGIENVGKIEIYFHVYDSSSYDSLFDTDCITIQTSAYDSMDTTPDDSGTELYNEGGIRIVGKTVDENSFWGTAILLYCENNTGRNITINVDDMSINGFMMTPYFYTTVYDGKKAFEDITILDSDLESNNIEEISDVELKFHITDADTYDTIVDTEPITFSAQ